MASGSTHRFVPKLICDFDFYEVVRIIVFFILIPRNKCLTHMFPG